ncbi:MAG: methylcobamide--CoM methyltransferase [Oscillospiraceae bacterium]|nr:methylcobamide--CoM methyltransferase [Oscillospiraceae bacterium]
MRKAYSKEEVIAAVERKPGAKAIPCAHYKWTGQGLGERYGTSLQEVYDKYPDDVYSHFFHQPGYFTTSCAADPEWRWGYKDYKDTGKHGLDANVLLEEWDELPLFLEKFPKQEQIRAAGFPDYKHLKDRAADKYRLGSFWSIFHEKFWGMRGMENLMLDYYDNMDGLKAVAAAFLEFWKAIVDIYAELGYDAIFTSDDLGHQTGPMMSPAVFAEFYFPLYKEIIGYTHGKGMHFWLHSCGDNTLLMPYLIEAGLDVFHPVQRGCMDEAETARKWGRQITFLYGADVQHEIPEGTPESIRAYLTDTIRSFKAANPDGGLCLAAGNGIQSDCPLENIDAMLDTMASAAAGAQ